jgi:pimeloyl-ACP methyl ester carboxylesterase
MQREEIVLHGHRVSYRQAGSGPVVVLIHGITGSSDTWLDTIEELSEHHTVVAPDMLGHGESAKPRGDYSLGAYASGIRDLLAALGHDRASVVGHSLGGGVAMQMAYQFPERVERLALVSSGGLGREVNILLRASVLPGSEIVLPLLTARPLMELTNAVASVVGSLGLRPGADMEEMWRGFSSLRDVEARAAFIHTLRGIIDPGGQRVSATDRLYLAAEMPSLIVWGERDPVIPFRHGLRANEAMPGSRLVSFPKAGHFPHRDNPRRFTRALLDFLEETDPAVLPESRLREMLREGA